MLRICSSAGHLNMWKLKGLDSVNQKMRSAVNLPLQMWHSNDAFNF
jgi:hypothetical protein